MSNENLGQMGEPVKDVQPQVRTAESKKLPWYRKMLIGFGVAAVASTTAVDAHAHSPITQENTSGHTITMTRPNDGPPKPFPEPTLTPESPLELVTSNTVVSGHKAESATTVTQVSPSTEPPVTPEALSTPAPVPTAEIAPESETVDPTTAMESAQDELMKQRAAEILAKLPVTKEVSNENGVLITVLTVTKDGLQSLTLKDCTKLTITRNGEIILEQELPADETTIDIAGVVEIGDKIEVKGDSNGNGTVGYQLKTTPGQ